jgi:MOSC domain-containing protein YiiM
MQWQGETVLTSIFKTSVAGRVRVGRLNIEGDEQSDLEVHGGVHIGDRFCMGSAEFVVTEPRMPCYKLALRFGRPDMVNRFLKSGRTGFYLAVLKEGDIGAGDAIEPIGHDHQRISIAAVVAAKVRSRADAR